MNPQINIGVLALQGAFREHIKALQALGVNALEVRLPHQLHGLAGIIIPGGESTTIGKLAVQYELIEPLRAFSAQGKPVWGTCAGAIFLSKEVGRNQPLLHLMDITVQRNAFGSQIDSFETDLAIQGVADAEHPFHCIFIRAPLIEKVGAQVRVLARLPQDGNTTNGIVAAQQGHLLATSFHPELTNDLRFHQYFLSLTERNHE
ncbi:MAG TPA: pyridoxal 5'-phosphate synthase glutaminase subunit PdxT [Anaerolineales bacterium]|nr:pyridoxal 5'-phosphate synthase glutaminase subunit PdxT [Anaerolineales bacterium]